MTRPVPMNHRIFRQSLPGIAAMLVTAAMSISASAAISGGPQNTNEIAAKQNLNARFYDAEQSYQQQLKVGRERYNQKQINRAKIIASMSAALQARQQTVVIQPVAAPAANADEPARGVKPALALGVLGAGLIGFCYHLCRPKLSSPRPKPTPPAQVSPDRTPDISLREHMRIDEAISGSFGLTPVEAEILYWVSEAKANREIATILNKSPRTIHKHVKHLCEKLGVENRFEAQRFGWELRRL